MDKITRIHIAKVPYEIGIDAMAALHKYLEAIRSELDADLADETMTDIELRITEILLDRGIQKNDVITLTDVQAMQDQLGSPSQFSSDKDISAANKKATNEKRLLRDPDNALIGGVCSGVGAYYNIDPNIVRIIFVVSIFFGALGFVLYLVLWLLLPVAKTNSDKLLMRGKPVTAAALQKYRNTTEQTLAKLRLREFYTLLGKICKIVLTAAGLLGILIMLVLIGLSWAALFTQPLHPLYEGYHLNYLFSGLAWLWAATIIGLLIAMIFRLWQKRSLLLKVTSFTLLGLFILSIAGMIITAPFIANHYKTIYGGNNLARPLQITSAEKPTTPTKLQIKANDTIDISYIITDQPIHATYQSYPGMGDPNVHIANQNGVISISASNVPAIVPNCVLNWCHNLYLPLKINLYGPQLASYSAQYGAQLNVSDFDQSNLMVSADDNSTINLTNGYSQTIMLGATNNSDISSYGVTAKTAIIAVDTTSIIAGPTSTNLQANLPGNCDQQVLSLDQDPLNIFVNGQMTTASDFNQNSCVAVTNFDPGMPPSPPPAPAIQKFQD